MQNIKVKNIIIGKQFEKSKNLEEVLKIAKNRKINIKVVEQGDKIIIENNLYFEILWPYSKDIITENVLNNNSLVCKMLYEKFSILFTGDIEDIAENKIITKYKNTNILNSTILKVSHHGSKTSTTQEFLNYVRPKVSLIGVEKNNKFGHPNQNVLERLKQGSTKIYRTDENGEIKIKINSKGKIWIYTIY